MLYLMAADFHGRMGAYKGLVKVVEKHKPDKVILLGDVIGGGTPYVINCELAKIYAQILAVRGNCDTYSDFGLLDVGDVGTCYCEKIGERNVFFTHGHIYGRTAFPPFCERGDVIFYGHYHCPEIAVIRGVTCVCVGSMGLPCGGSEPSFCLFDGEKIEIRNMETDEIIVEVSLKEKDD